MSYTPQHGNEIYDPQGNMDIINHQDGYHSEEPAINLVSLFGMPFVGKGTQIGLLRDLLEHAEIVPVGDTIRNAIKDNNHRFHKLFIDDLDEINAGGMVPNHKIFKALHLMLEQTDSNLILFDGFPRDVEQGKVSQDFYAELASNRNRPVVVHNVLYSAPDETVLERGFGRWHQSMEAVIRQNRIPQKYVEGMRNQTLTSKQMTNLVRDYGVSDILRADDYPPTLENRIRTYYKPGSTHDMLEGFKAQGRLKEIDASGNRHEVHLQTLMSIGWVPYAPEGQLILPGQEAQRPQLPAQARR